ncbi:hypothetical protein [Aminipila terrae]|uniref:Uncharacterized protein n=1 Tax=Aminipila terrae TaxID=2697030 RepID=A0A6P1MJ84_9FIRM|nr:hypothetical protein [Aminipila terrae]QHI72058.1 hypothetical protein Ami3637_06290 [Aminipila terrae]
MCFNERLTSLLDLKKDLAYEVIKKVKKMELPIILWGAGGILSFVLENLTEKGIQVSAICDNDLNKCGKTYAGIKILPFLELKKYIEIVYFLLQYAMRNMSLKLNHR